MRGKQHPMISQPRKRTQRQHFVPRLLLKGFAHRARGGEHYVYEFRRGCSPHEVNVDNVGVEKDFYERGGGDNIEQKLSRKESQYASLVHNLRRGRIDPEQKHLIDDFITHLVVRTKNVRDGLSDLATGALDSFERVFTDKQHRVKLEQKIIEEMLENDRLKPILGRLPRGQQRALLSKALSAPGVDPALMIRKFLQFAGPNLNVEEAARDAQIRALGSDDALARRKEALAPIVWSIVTWPQGTLVLGDLGPVARFVESPTLQPPIKFTTTPEAIFLPVSSQHLLVGQRDTTSEEVDVETVNTGSVELSRDLFVASTNTERELNYLRHLGCRSALLNNAEMDDLSRKTLE